MKLKGLSILLLFIFCLGGTSVYSQVEPNGKSIGYDFDKLRGMPPFRSIPWGASKEYVLQNDPNPRKETGKDYLVLKGQLDDIDVNITYFFWEGHFIKGVYLTTDILGEYSTYFETFTRFKDLLVQKYGKPIIDLTNWVDVSYKNRPDKWLLALSRGHLEHFAYWSQEQIVISIKLGAVDERPAIKIEYYIKNFDEKMNQSNNKDVLKDL